MIEVSDAEIVSDELLSPAHYLNNMVDSSHPLLRPAKDGAPTFVFFCGDDN